MFGDSDWNRKKTATSSEIKMTESGRKIEGGGTGKNENEKKKKEKCNEGKKRKTSEKD